MLARRLFMTLEKSPFYNAGVYLVLNDCNYVTTIYALSDEDAITEFERLVDEMNKGE